ncbi:hypothetical protein R1sor_000414 [Riccia sorocarpa]|uniref:EthD domain-containing protein n=1 Tax=Riccia sorocarpa TaxID=122646 RepID=A0ABD3GVE5_9MARC
MSPKRNSLVKLVVIIKRKKGMSFEEFDKYWKEVHSPLVCGLPIFKEKIVKYNQVHLDLQRQQKSGVENGIPVCNDYDGFCELYAKSYQDLMDFFGSDIYKNIVGPDEAKFAERDECKTLFVYDEVHLDADDPSI